MNRKPRIRKVPSGIKSGMPNCDWYCSIKGERGAHGSSPKKAYEAWRLLVSAPANSIRSIFGF